jgi:hypothetical protein
MRRLLFALFLVGVFGCGKSQPAEGPDAAPPPPPTKAAVAASSAPVNAPAPNISTCDTNGRLKCFDGKYALLCTNGHNEIIPCKGPGGCRNGTPDAICDDKVGADGDPCRMDSTGGDSNHACSPDRHEELACTAGKFQPWRVCRGSRGCTFAGAKIDCDTTTAEPNDACTEPGAAACRIDKDMMVECKNGHFVPSSTCRGPRGCVPAGASSLRPICDDSVANIGDTCEPADELRCTVDKRAEVKCAGGRYAKKADCPKGCTPGFGGKDPTCQ